MKIPIVNEQDEIIEYKERNNVTPDDTIRISICWVVNNVGEVLIAQRSAIKAVHPNKWSSASVGTNEEGETYESNICKELTEELGIQDVTPVFIKKMRIKTSEANYFAGVFLLKGYYSVSDFTMQEEELQALKFVSISELSTMVDSQKDIFTPGFLQVFEFFKNSALIGM